MPYVEIHVAESGYTTDQKRAVIARVTAALAEEMGRPPASTFVVINEVPNENWGIGYETLADIKARDD